MHRFALKVFPYPSESSSEPTSIVEHHLDCAMCTSISAHTHLEPWNIPIAESLNFVAIPSLGALVPGWLLILPRQHFLNLAHLPANLRAEFDLFRASLRDRVLAVYGQFIEFEHGPVIPNSLVGCSVDHAHMHIVPLGLDLRPLVSAAFGENLNWVRLDQGLFDEQLQKSRSPYLYFGKDDSSWMTEHPNLGSQLFRRAIATALQMDGEFNWRLHPQIQIVEQTIKDLSPSA